MKVIEIVTIVVSTLIVIGVLASYFYKRIKHIPTGDCSCCHNKGKQLVKMYKKKYHNGKHNRNI